MTGRAITFSAGDGLALRGRVFDAADAAMTVLMLPGIGVPQRAFRHIAGWLSKRGIRSLTLDYRGIGESATTSEANRSATLLTWARRDVVAALEYAESEWDEPVVLFAHSFGGQMLGLVEALKRVEAAVLVGSQLGQLRYWDGLQKWKLTAYWYLVLPVSCALFDPLPAAVGFGTRLPRGAAAEWGRWGRSPEWFLSWEPSAPDTFAAFDKPLMAFAIEDDSIAPPRAAEALLERFDAERVTKREVTPKELGLEKLGHVGFFRPGPTQSLWQEMLDFYLRHV